MIRFAVLALMLTGVAQAADAPVGSPAEPKVYALTPEEKAQVLESASRRPDADNPALLPAQSGDRRPHGEVGAMIGTGGARGIYGVMGVPLGDNASAVVAFSNSRLPGYYGYGSRYGSGLYGGGSLGATQSQSFGIQLRQGGW